MTEGNGAETLSPSLNRIIKRKTRRTNWGIISGLF